MDNQIRQKNECFFRLFLEPSEMIALIFKRIERVFLEISLNFFDTQTHGSSNIWPLAKMTSDKIVMVCNHFLFEFKDWVHRQKEDQIERCVRKRRQYLLSSSSLTIQVVTQIYRCWVIWNRKLVVVTVFLPL